jgi:parvulin-like peptidyl-prolyl isomerase
VKHAALPLLAAILSGAVAGDAASRLAAFRNVVGHWANRGNVVALVGPAGIYQSDVDRRVEEINWRSGDDDDDKSVATAREQLLAETVALLDGGLPQVGSALVRRERIAMEGQLASGKAWSEALHQSNLTESDFARSLGDNLRVRHWIEDRIANALSVTEAECQQYFNRDRPAFSLPPRFRVAHLFLAANAETPLEIFETKRRTIHHLSDLVKHGKRLGELVPMFTDDDATRDRGGDLGYAARFRMPEDFMTAVEHLRPGQVSEPVQTRLGFHLIQLIDLKPARELTFAEARPELVARLKNTKRVAAVRELARRLTDAVAVE